MRGVLAVGLVVFLTGCAAAVVPDRSDSNMAVIRRHFTTGTDADADRQAAGHCSRFGKQAILASKSDGGLLNFSGKGGEYSTYYYKCVDVAAVQIRHQQEQQRNFDDADHQTCLSFGLVHGTQPYADCRLKLRELHLREATSARTAADATQTQATMQQMLQVQQRQADFERQKALMDQSQKLLAPPQQPTVALPPRTCTTTGNVTNCW